jgi:hypothetical protein
MHLRKHLHPKAYRSTALNRAMPCAWFQAGTAPVSSITDFTRQGFSRQSSAATQTNLPLQRLHLQKHAPICCAWAVAIPTTCTTKKRPLHAFDEVTKHGMFFIAPQNVWKAPSPNVYTSAGGDWCCVFRQPASPREQCLCSSSDVQRPEAQHAVP